MVDTNRISTEWLIPSHLMKDQHALSIKFMNIISERDGALQERNLALSERKAALAERDMAILQRDTALVERNNALIERDNAIAAFEYRENATMSVTSSPTCPERYGTISETRYMHHSEHGQHPPHLAEVPCHARELHFADALPIQAAASEAVKPQRNKRTKSNKPPLFKRASKPSKKGKTVGEDLNKHLPVAEPNKWKMDHGRGGCGEDLNKELALPEVEWKDQDLGLNHYMHHSEHGQSRQIFDDSAMPVPVCSCTGALQQCYKWGTGGWQSACCTTTMSIYPLPMMPNKRHARVSGRKMSGSAFTKLLSRLAIEGYDLSVPVDLKDHWARHGTNRYITIK
ncbi:hypothetical protein AQUCO_00700374v1 [Aquilegia coerulea]|uniref:GAGA-binding transcriptional activator n=1 Tax=Aquilegia coerulea TaxID=218851 RepID=A0A2G5EK89_AQUCA|nr:hypothetical protein AQUCO_00700374v1 [Aquilegia coerulea]